ncbi:PQQ-dependent sugar dehydrogenase [Jiangella endophytica]|uniref:PQQ-dependent sugar dehydrogenase n=1 Tax=Jiangella endophytica TaxID=1623398 RepID=UPI0018E52D02|nr:PQQ-dependent sugar dehydrogenase [Jiangella endophytica]
MHRSMRAAVIALVAVLISTTAGPALAHHPDDPVPEPEDRFQKVLLEENGLTQPMRLAVAGDGRVVYIERDGRVKVWDPDESATVVAGTVPVRVTGEAGLIGLALAPDFDRTGHLYLHFSRPDWQQSFVTRVSRFTLSGDNVLDLASEAVVIDIQHPAGVGGGHSAGDLLATEDGYLFISTGDNTNCCASRGFPGTDERPGQADGDAQRTSANTNDLNGKVLRIIPLPDGGYANPQDNLFPESRDPGGKTRPEIYAMGFRNPFTLGDWDPETQRLWVADYGPDAVLADPERGPAGHVNLFLFTAPGNAGWPYCTMDEVAYNDWDYVADRPGPWFDCDAPVNDSPNNTGLTNLPPVTGSTIHYTYEPQEYFPALYGGGAMAGPRYDYDPDNPSRTKFPEWFDGRHFLYDWTTDWIQTTHFSHDEVPVPEGLTEFLPDGDFRKPMDMEFGPDGSLYLLEYGNGWGASNDDAGIYRIDYVEGNRTPTAQAATDTDAGPLPLTVEFDASGSSDVDGDELTYAWDVDGDGTTDATGVTAAHTYTEAGAYAARLTVTDTGGAASVSTVEIVAGNSRPTVVIEAPADGGFAEFGEDLPFRVTVTDPEDGEIDCTQVRVRYQLGHNQHGHPMGEATPDENCEGVLVPGRDAAHGPGAYVFHILEATYTDGGADAAPALTASDDIVLHPRRYEARTYPSGEGVGLYYGQLFMPGRGNWFSFPDVDVAGIDHLTMEFATREAGASVTVRSGAPDGPVIAEFADIPDTGSVSLHERVYRTFSAPVADPGLGPQDVYVVGDWPAGSQPELFVRAFQFQTVPEVSGVLAPAAPDGENGWYVTPPTLTTAASGGAGGAPPLWDRQYSLDGETWTVANEPVPVTADGDHAVRVRAIDVAGVTSPVATVPVRLDATAPVAAVEGVGAGATLTRRDAAEATVTATDATSGVAAVSVTLDGAPAAAPVATWRLPAGPHTVGADAVDVAGNGGSAAVPFTVTTSTADLAWLVDRLHDDGELDRRAWARLAQRIDVVRRHEQAGRTKEAARALQAVAELAADPGLVPDESLRGLIAGDVEVIRAGLS